MKKLNKNFFTMICFLFLSLLLTVVNAQHFNSEGQNPSSSFDNRNNEHWSVSGDPSGSIWAIFLAGATIDGQNMVQGDEIAIFDGDLIVGVFTLTQICTPANQFDNTLNAFSLLVNGPGYTIGNIFTMKAWDQSENLEFNEFNCTFYNPYGDAYIGDVFPEGEPYSIMSIDFSLTGNQQIELSEGFSFISSRIIPEDPDMLIVMASVLNENLDFIRNSQGQTLRKIGPNWVNGIGDWKIDEGYLVKMFNEDSFIIEGEVVDPVTPISIEEGFQFVSYFPETSIDALIAFETILGDDLDFIRNSQGQILRKIGPNWVNGIGDCNPGEGYLVKMFADDVLIYPITFGVPCPGIPTVTYEGQVYNTVLIGDQCWLKENLNVGTMINGTVEMTNNGVIEKYCYDNDPANCEIYGGLYQWNEMMEYVTDTAVQGICPEGWHLPTDHEWEILEGTVDSQYPVGDPIWEWTGLRGFDAGLNLKSTSGWYGGGNGSGLYNYEALPGGYRYTDGNFYTITYNAYFCSSSEINSSSAWSRYIHYGYDGIVRGNNYDKDHGFSVRCVQDNSIFDNLSIRAKEQLYELSDPKRKSNEAVHFIFEGGNPAEPVYTIYIDGLKIGDEVAAFDSDKMVGVTRINSVNVFENELPVFGTLIKGQGYEKDNPIIFKVWSENSIVHTDFTMEAIYDAYVSDVYPKGDGKYSIVNITKGSIENTEETISVYPNPSEGIFNISIEGVKGKVQMKVFDVHSNDYRFFEIVGTGNIISEKLDLKDLAAGVYFLSFSGEDFSRVKKIVVQ